MLKNELMNQLIGISETISNCIVSQPIKNLSSALTFISTNTDLSRNQVIVSKSEQHSKENIMEISIADKETGDIKWVLEWDKEGTEPYRIAIPYEVAVMRSITL